MPSKNIVQPLAAGSNLLSVRWASGNKDNYMSNQRFVSATRFFTEALLITTFLCGVTIIVGYVQGTDLSLWWLLLAAPFFFGFSCTALFLSGYVMVESE